MIPMMNAGDMNMLEKLGLHAQNFSGESWP